MSFYRFNLKVTSIGTRHRPYHEKEKLLPCFTIHSFSSFNTKGFYYTNELIKNNSITVEDVFEPDTLKKLSKNESLFKQTHFSIYFGTCFTFCHLQKMPVWSGVWLRMRRNLKLKGGRSLKKVR